MNKTLLIFPLLAACVAAPGRRVGDWEARASAVASRPTLSATVDHRFLGQTVHVSESRSGTDAGGRLELNTALESGEVMGFYADVRYGDAEGADLNGAAVGLLGRGYLTAGERLRTFLESRVGYRGTWWGDRYGDGVEVGAALGLEVPLSRKLALTATVGWDYATASGDGWSGSTNGPTGSVGLAVRF